MCSMAIVNTAIQIKKNYLKSSFCSVLRDKLSVGNTQIEPVRDAAAVATYCILLKN